MTELHYFFVTFLLLFKLLPRKIMLLNSCDGLKTRCSAIASPSDVTKRQEEQDSFTPLEGRGGGAGREERSELSISIRYENIYIPSLTVRKKPSPSSAYRQCPHTETFQWESHHIALNSTYFECTLDSQVIKIR